MRFGSSGSVSRNQICCISKHERSLPYCDEGDESIFYLTLSDKRKKEDEKNVCWYVLGLRQTLKKKKVESRWPSTPPLLPFYTYPVYTDIISSTCSREAVTSPREQARTCCIQLWVIEVTHSLTATCVVAALHSGLLRLLWMEELVLAL